MKTKLLALAATVLAVSVAPAANAATLASGSSIDFGGYIQGGGAATLNALTSIDFVSGSGAAASPGTAGAINTYGSATGSFAGLSCTGGTCGLIQDIANFTVGAQSISNFFSLTGGNNASPINFDLTSIDRINRGDPSFLTFVATGTIRYDGFDATPASFLFSAQGGTATSFSATALTSGVPEAATWAMMVMAFGLVGGAMRYQRRRATVTFA